MRLALTSGVGFGFVVGIGYGLRVTLLLALSISAPRACKVLTDSAWPLLAARITGVSPDIVARFTFAPSPCSVFITLL